MDDVQTAKAPMHLWIVGILSLIWNAFGGYHYLMARTRNMEFLSSTGGDANEILAYLDGYPIWAHFGWGLGVWAAVAGSVLLMMRSRWATAACALSLLGMALSFGYQYLGGATMPAGMNEGPGKYMPVAIIIVGIALYFYARAQRAKGVLR